MNEEKISRIQELQITRNEYMRKGLTIQEVKVLRELVDLIAEVYGKKSDDYIKILNELGGTLKYVNEFDDAEKAIIEAREIIAEKYGTDNISYATSTLNLAEVYRFMKKVDKLEDLYIQVITIYEQNDLVNDYLYASVCNNLGLFYQEEKKYEKALVLHEKSLGILKDKREYELQYATTLSNLVIPYDKTGNKEKSKECLDESLKLIEKLVGKEHNLYSASLNNLAIYYFNEGKFDESLELFEKSADICKKTFGENSVNYKNLIGNIDFVKDTIEKRNKLLKEREEKERKNSQSGENSGDEEGYGITIARKYCNDVLLPYFKEKHLSLLEKISIGIAGEGSECFGYDDILSRDHDFTFECCIWVNDEEYDNYCKENNIKEELEKLAFSYDGYKSKIVGNFNYGVNDRRGILKVSDWYYKFLGVKRFPLNIKDWLKIPDYSLATATNGKIFYTGEKSEFLQIREELKKGYCSDILKYKIVKACMKIAQSGQYNLERCMLRGNYVASRQAETEFINEAISLVYLLNNGYMPFYKWAYKGIEQFGNLGNEMSSLIEKLVKSSYDDVNTKKVIIEDVCNILIREMKKKKYINYDINSNFMQDIAIEIQKTIEDEDISRMILAII